MYIGDKDGNKLYNEENGNVAYSFNMTSKKGNVISYSISPWITEQGEYTIVIPAGCFAVDGVDINKEFVRHFTIKDSEPTWSIPLYEGAESGTGTVGSQDHPMRGFSEIILTFPEDVQVKAGEPTTDNTPTLTTVSFSGSGSNRSELNTPVDGTTVSVGAEGHIAVIAFDPPLTTDGDYHLTIPAGCIQMLGALGDYVPVRAYSTYFTINDITTCEITPVTDSNVVKLDEIDIKFTEAKIVTPDPQADVKITLFDEEGNEVNGHTLAITMEGLEARVSITPALTKAGKYRVAVPEGRFLCQSSASDDPERTLAYDLWYTVVDPTLVNVSPAVDSELTKLDRVAVEFYNAVRIESKESAIKILNANGKEVTGYTVSVEVNPVDDQEYFFNFTPAITASGKYTIVVPAGSFACKYSVDGEARENEEYTFAYVVKNPTSCT
ncbi:MAG: hypothetical protein K2I91_00755, partial [Muribaculaceae bacterium]|nr:hypothetical protein [Muribaculaceae bacterium]